MSNQPACFLARFHAERSSERTFPRLVSVKFQSLHFRVCEFSRWEPGEKVSLKSYQRHIAMDKTFTETPGSPATSSPQTLNQTRNIAVGFGTTASLLRLIWIRLDRGRNQIVKERHFAIVKIARARFTTTVL